MLVLIYWEKICFDCIWAQNFVNRDDFMKALKSPDLQTFVFNAIFNTNIFVWSYSFVQKYIFLSSKKINAFFCFEQRKNNVVIALPNPGKTFHHIMNTHATVNQNLSLNYHAKVVIRNKLFFFATSGFVKRKHISEMILPMCLF